MKRLLFPLAVAMAMASCTSKYQEIETKADDHCRAIVEAFQSGNLEEAERATKAMNDYARSLTDEELSAFMSRYEEHVGEISAAASLNAQRAIQEAAKGMDNDSIVSIIKTNIE